MAGNQQSSAGARAGAPLSAAQSYQAVQTANKKKVSDKKAKDKADKAALAAAQARAGGLFGSWYTSTSGGANIPIAEKALELTGKLLYNGQVVTANKMMNDFFTWTPQQQNAFDSKLKSLKLVDPNKPIDPDNRQSIYFDAIGRASTFYSLSGGTNPVDGSFEGTLQAYKGKFEPSGAANLPSRSINELSDAAINAIIDQVSQAQLRKKINDPNERAALVAKIKQQVKQGIVTTTKKVRNKDTGKLEEVTQRSGLDVQDIQLKLAEDLKSSHAEDYQLNQTLGFGDALSRVLSKGL